MGDIKVEFAVQMRGEECAKKVREALGNVGSVNIDTKESTTPWIELRDRIASTGRKVVLSGFGGQSAVAMINTTGSDVDQTPIQGVVRFTAISKDAAGVVVDGVVDGLRPGLHGIHVHECGDISHGCRSVGEHYNPRQSPHGGLGDGPEEKHAGDLGNIRAEDNGRATFRMIEPHLEIWDIIGRSVVVTDSEDDLGRGGNVQSKVDGNAGNRIACGIIARSAGILENFKKLCACDGVTIWDERKVPGSNNQPKL